MSDAWEDSIRWLLGKDPVAGQTVGPDGVVDPASFPEDEFPVRCPRCNYLLRGLPDGRCPECGTAFERGRLLVAQYVLKPTWRSIPTGKWTDRLLSAGVLLWAFALGMAYALAQCAWARLTPVSAPPSADWLFAGIRSFLVVMLLATLVLLVGVALCMFQVHRHQIKRGRVLRSLRRSDE